jgi:hypothetical protein
MLIAATVIIATGRLGVLLVTFHALYYCLLYLSL